MKVLTRFSAIYCSGLLIPNQASVAAISLLFDKVYLPNHIEFVVDFAKSYHFRTSSDSYKQLELRAVDDNAEDPFGSLADSERDCLQIS